MTQAYLSNIFSAFSPAATTHLKPSDASTPSSMSALNSFFNRAPFGTRCKTCLNLAISRIKLLRNKRDVQLKQMRGEIAQYLRTGQEPVARIRVEHVIREQNIMAAYDVLELFCEFVLARVPILEAQKECPVELQEAIASIIFASPRCSDLPEFMQIRSLFTAKYGKEFVAAASDLRPIRCSKIFSHTNSER